MIHLKAALITAVTLVIGLGTFVLASIYDAYPEAAPAPTWIMVGAAVAIWGASLFLISRLPDKS